MSLCVPIKDLRDTAAFDEMVSTSPTPVIVTKNGYDRFVCVKSSDFSRWGAGGGTCPFARAHHGLRAQRAEGKTSTLSRRPNLEEKYGL